MLHADMGKAPKDGTWLIFKYYNIRDNKKNGPWYVAVQWDWEQRTKHTLQGLCRHDCLCEFTQNDFNPAEIESSWKPYDIKGKSTS